MATSFDVTAETAAEVAEVRQAFQEEAYWLARIAKYGGDSMTLDSLQAGRDGTIVVDTTQDLRKGMLPGGIERILPGDARIMRTERWRPGPDGVQLCGEFIITGRGVPGSGSGDMVLTAGQSGSAIGSSLRIRGMLEVRVPLVGSRIERYIADQIAKQVPEVQQFTADWIVGEA